MTQECPSLSRKSPHSNNSLGEGKAKTREEVVVWGGEPNKRTRLPLVTAHPHARTGKSITCRIKQKLVHKAKLSESSTHPSNYSLPFLLFFFLVVATSSSISLTHQQQRASFRHTLWNPTQVRRLSGPNALKTQTPLMTHRWYIPVFITVCRPGFHFMVAAFLFANIKLMKHCGQTCFNIRK